MEAFEAKYGVRLTQIMREVYDVRKQASLCARKGIIKQIKVAKVKENRDLLSEISKSNDLSGVDRLKLQIDRDLHEIGKINEFLSQNTSEMLRERERALERLAQEKLNTTTAALTKKFLHEYEKALSVDQELENKMVEAEQVAKQKAEEKVLEAEMVELERIQSANKVHKATRNDLGNLEESDHITDSENNKKNNQDLRDNFSPFEKDQFNRSFMKTFKLNDQENLRKVKTVPCEISKSSSFQFEQMKESIGKESIKTFTRQSSIHCEVASSKRIIKSSSERYFIGQSNSGEKGENKVVYGNLSETKSWQEQYEEDVYNQGAGTRSRNTKIQNNKSNIENDFNNMNSSFPTKSFASAKNFNHNHNQGSLIGNSDELSSSSKKDEGTINCESIKGILTKKNNDQDDFFNFINFENQKRQTLDKLNEDDEPSLEDVMTGKARTYRQKKNEWDTE